MFSNKWLVIYLQDYRRYSEAVVSQKRNDHMQVYINIINFFI